MLSLIITVACIAFATNRCNIYIEIKNEYKAFIFFTAYCAHGFIMDIWFYISQLGNPPELLRTYIHYAEGFDIPQYVTEIVLTFVVVAILHRCSKIAICKEEFSNYEMKNSNIKNNKLLSKLSYVLVSPNKLIIPSEGLIYKADKKIIMPLFAGYCIVVAVCFLLL